MLWPKKDSYKEFDNEKKFMRIETGLDIFVPKSCWIRSAAVTQLLPSSEDELFPSLRLLKSIVSY